MRGPCGVVPYLHKDYYSHGYSYIQGVIFLCIYTWIDRDDERAWCSGPLPPYDEHTFIIVYRVWDLYVCIYIDRDHERSWYGGPLPPQGLSTYTCIIIYEGREVCVYMYTCLYTYPTTLIKVQIDKPWGGRWPLPRDLPWDAGLCNYTYLIPFV